MKKWWKGLEDSLGPLSPEFFKIISALLAALIIDIVLLVVLLPLFSDDVASGWSPIFGTFVASRKAEILIFVSLISFIVIYQVITEFQRRKGRK